nr:MAG TPA: hypothetical protein [Caudoviricetes sp.]
MFPDLSNAIPLSMILVSILDKFSNLHRLGNKKN